MDLKRIVSELKKERGRIDHAIAALEGRSTVAKTDRTPKKRKVNQKLRKRRLSAAGRRRISEAMKKRWAARRKSNGSKAMPEAA
jgi:hypothetical protein